jgi:L-fucose isomerase-like protein
MANGRFWLIPLGLGGPVLRIAAALWASSISPGTAHVRPVYVAALLAVAHVLATVKAAGINWALAPWQPVERRITDEATLANVFTRFERWQAVRAALQFLTFACGVWALAVNAR